MLLAGRAVELGKQTDRVTPWPHASLVLADVLRLRGDDGEAAAVVEAAMRSYEQKGNVAAAARLCAAGATQVLASRPRPSR
jgi:hypothetical protein